MQDGEKCPIDGCEQIVARCSEEGCDLFVCPEHDHFVAGAPSGKLIHCCSCPTRSAPEWPEK